MDLEGTTQDSRIPDGNRIRFRPFAAGDAEMIKDVYLHRHYDLLDLKEGVVVFDVGAHIGSFALKATRLVGAEGLLVAREPEDENCRLLMENVEQSTLGNIVPLPLALSDSQGPRRISLAVGAVDQNINTGRHV